MKEGIKSSDLKKLTKFVLNEIKPVAQKQPKPKNAFQALIQHAQKSQETSPVANDITVAHNLTKTLTSNIRRSIKAIINSKFKKNNEDYRVNAESLYYSGDDLINVCGLWAAKTHQLDNNKHNELLKVMSDISAHLIQISKQTNDVIVDLETYQNNINVIKKVNHLSEIIRGLDDDVDNLFKIALSAGLGNKKEK